MRGPLRDRGCHHATHTVTGATASERCHATSVSKLAKKCEKKYVCRRGSDLNMLLYRRWQGTDLTSIELLRTYQSLS